ncbi:MAG: hypothetical protein KatS3mg015_0320 [Fimbriimonadales bacterium]|jgi:hypothetical protein|nr:MAG: hypothetical protein KatS3mg015_0320 [Fimbriimonadales bacterium]
MVTPRRVERKLGSPILLVAGAVSFAVLVWMALASLRKPDLEGIAQSAIQATLNNDPDAYYELLIDREKEMLSREQFRKLWEISVEPRLSGFRATGKIETHDNEFQALAVVRLTNDKGTELTYAVNSDLTDRWAGVKTTSVLTAAWLAEHLTRVPGTPEDEVDALKSWVTGLTEDLPKLREAGITSIPNPETHKPIPLDKLLEIWQGFLAEAARHDSGEA